MLARRIIDLRGQLPTAPGQGSGRALTAVAGQVLHYSAVNYPEDWPVLDILNSEATFHIGPYLREAGIAYHFCVDPQQGTVYQTRDEDACLWHCGAWGAVGNGNALSIHVPGGSALRMSDRAVQSLLWLFRRNEAKHGFRRGMLRGHSEVGESSCPGPLMGQIVYPYRAGTLNYEGETMSRPVTLDPVTGVYIHPDLQDTYVFEKHGHALLPACGYSDGKVRQLFERACLESGGRPGEDPTASLGAALLHMTGGGDQGNRYPDWPGVHPLV